MTKYVTDYGVLMALFIDVLIKKDNDLAHKSFMKKITNKLGRYHKRRAGMCSASEERCKKAVYATEKAIDGSIEISLGALCWLIHNRHKEALKPYGFDKQPFEDMNKYFNAQGVILKTAKVLIMIEEEMYNEN